MNRLYLIDDYVVFVSEDNARASATGDNDADADDDKTIDVNGGTMTSECRRHRKVIYEVIV